MKQNIYRTNKKTAAGHTAFVDHTAVNNHNVANSQGMIYPHNCQGAEAEGDKVAASAVSNDSMKTNVAPTAKSDDHRPLSFNKKNMIDLVIAYDSYRKLEQSIMLLTDDFPDNPILQGLRHIDEIILSISPAFDDMEGDVEYDLFMKIMDDPLMGVEQKAEVLMNWLPDGRLSGSDGSIVFIDESDGSSDSGSSSCTAHADGHNVDFDGPVSVDKSSRNTWGNMNRKGVNSEDKDNATSEIMVSEEPAAVPFTVSHMELLLTVYDGYNELREGLIDLLKIDPEEGVFQKISQLENLFCKLSPIYDPKKDFYNQEFSRVLLGDEGAVEERAKKLMGMV